jgi:hypothetical protein
MHYLVFTHIFFLEGRSPSTKTQNMMMYQILCGHVNYALGKTRMQEKNTKRHFILDSCLY